MEKVLQKIKSALHDLEGQGNISELSEISIPDNNNFNEENKKTNIYRVRFVKQKLTYIFSVHMKGFLIHIDMALTFQYEMNSKTKQEKILSIVNKFNEQIPGFKAILEKNKGRVLVIIFKAQTLMPASLDIPFQEYISLNTNTLITSPMLFSLYLDAANYKHKKITN